MGFQYKLCVTYSINANVAIKVSDSQQKYVVLSAMRRSGGISKNLLMKKLKSKVYVSFLIRLYYEENLVSVNTHSAHPNARISNFRRYFILSTYQMKYFKA